MTTNPDQLLVSCLAQTVRSSVGAEALAEAVLSSAWLVGVRREAAREALEEAIFKLGFVNDDSSRLVARGIGRSRSMLETILLDLGGAVGSDA